MPTVFLICRLISGRKEKPKITANSTRERRKEYSSKRSKTNTLSHSSLCRKTQAKTTKFRRWFWFTARRVRRFTIGRSRGRTEQTGINNSNYADYRQSVENHGPEQSHFTDYANDVTSQWSYHALAAVIACTTYISSLDCVDAARVGVTGVSYGGYLTCLAAAYDDRYAFAIPVYGTLANRYGSGPFAGYINSNKAYGLDDENQLSLNRTPMLMVTSENDTHFSLNSTLRTANAAKADICVVPGLTHGHNQCLGVPEIFAFADEICFGKTPTIRIISPADETGYMKVALPKGVNVAGADYYYTFDENLNAETIWNTIACDVNGGEIFAAADAKHKNGFILVKDSRGYRLASFTKTSDPIDN